MISHTKYIIIRNLWGYMLICQNTEGVHAQIKVGNPCTRAVVFNLFCSIALLQELCYETDPTHDFSVVPNIIVF